MPYVLRCASRDCHRLAFQTAAHRQRARHITSLQARALVSLCASRSHAMILIMADTKATGDSKIW
ncbi:hypothetical protein XH97_06820 [Bradyrhizobium sp. CCBAU 53380]|nr:hypothetical protein [Bradyrhizobium sp. CCBAU 53380]